MSWLGEGDSICQRKCGVTVRCSQQNKWFGWTVLLPHPPQGIIGFWQPTPVFLLGESHGQRNLVGYSPRVTESRTRLSDFTFTLSVWGSGSLQQFGHCLLLPWVTQGRYIFYCFVFFFFQRGYSNLFFIYLFFKFYFIFKLYNIVLVLPNIYTNVFFLWTCYIAAIKWIK